MEKNMQIIGNSILFDHPSEVSEIYEALDYYADKNGRKDSISDALVALDTICFRWQYETQDEMIR